MTVEHETRTRANGAANGHHESHSSNGDASSTGSGVPVAIIGISCRFGGSATSPSKLWDLCMAAEDAWTPIPQERFDAAGLYDKRKGRLGRHVVQGGYFLKDIALFDSAFYNYPTDVANAMDPQIRMLLESVYESVDDAGIPIQRLAGSNTSVFAGSFCTDYSQVALRDPETMQPSYETGNGIAMLSNRISHFYDFQGPSMTIDTGCSTGLVALHQACHSLRSGESDISIVGSSLICLSPDMFIALGISGVLGPTGKCFAWDERAEGYGRGEGIASFVLKPLPSALRDGDHIHAVIRETGLNQDGKTPTITSPSMDAQVKLIQDVYKRAGLNPADTGYVEAHMTGTPTGDPIEAEALYRTFGQGRSADDAVLVGSLKPNIGHTEPVSGLAAIIKSIFVLKHGVIPPNVNYEKTNPNIPLTEWRLKVPTEVTPWPANKLRRVSVNNFGYGGTNAHVILEPAPASGRFLKEMNGLKNGTHTDKVNGWSKDATTGHKDKKLNGTSKEVTVVSDVENAAEGEDTSLVYVLSAKDSAVAQQLNKNLAEYLREAKAAGKEPSPTDLAFTLAERKSRFPWVTAIRAKGMSELADRLDDPDRKASRATKVPRVGFVFNGQGAQWYAMGRELIEGYPVFRRSLLAADKILKDYGAPWSLHEELLRDEKNTRVHEICLSQPLSVALQLCLVDLLASWGITPSAVTSHSSGEIAAAYSVGALSFHQALGVVYFRGVLAQKHHERSSVAGGMLAAGLGAEAAAEYLKDTKDGIVVVACHNSPDSVTISGDMPAIDEVAARLTKDGVFARKLNVPLAYHSHHMAAMAQDYTDRLREILPVPTRWSGALFASPVTGGIITSPKALTAEHFVRNLVSPVRFSQAFEQMCFSEQEVNLDVILEIGAHGTLSGPIRQILRDRRIPYISCLTRQKDAVHTMQDASCALLGHGYPVLLADVNAHEHGRYVPGLPIYPWNHTTVHWVESRLYREYRYKRFRPHELLGSPISGTNRQTPTWRNFLRIADIGWLTDHKLGGDTVLPGAGYVAMAIEAMRLLTDPTEETIAGYRLREVDISNALTIPETAMGVEIQLVLHPCSEKELDYKGWYEFEVWSVSGPDDAWVQHCKGVVTAETVSKAKEAVTKVTMAAPRADAYFPAGTPVKEVQPAAIFAGLRGMKLFHGPVFQNLIRSRATPKQSITTLAVSPAAADVEQAYVLHPTTLDSLIQAAYVSIPDGTQRGAMVVPRSIRHLYVPRDLQRRAGETLTAFVDLVQADRRGAQCTAVAVNGEGDDVSSSQLQLDGLYCQAVPLDAEDLPKDQSSALCSQTRWEVDIAHGVPSAFTAALRAPLDEEDVGFEKKLDRVCYNFILDAVTQLAASGDGPTRPAHLQRFYTWMKSVVARGQAGELGPGSRVWSKTNSGLKQRMADEVAAENAACQLIVRVGGQLAGIVLGDVNPVALLEADGLLDRYYETLPRLQKRSYAHLRKIIAQFAVAQPGATVLEIGGRTGAATAHILEAFGERAEDGVSGTLLGHYDFSDISADHFEAAKLKCVPWEALVDFKTFDIANPDAQDFVAGSYDLIVAAGDLPAASDLSQTLATVRRLLKPNGKLLLVQTTQVRLDTQMLFGTLPSGRQSQDDADLVISVDKWDDMLKTAGFAGVEAEIGDCEDAQFRSSSVVLTTAVADSATTKAYPAAISIVHADDARPAQTWLDKLKLDITKKTGAAVSVEGLSKVQARPDAVYLFVPDMVAPFLHNMDQPAFDRLKMLMLQGQGLLWLSCGNTITAEKPLYAQSFGLLRTAKQEDSTKRYVSLDFEVTADGPWSSATIPHIVQVLQQSFDMGVDAADIEWEYAVQNGMLHVARVYPSLSQDRASSETPVDPAPVLQSLWQQGRPLVWEPPQTVGSLSDLYFIDDAQAAEQDISSGMVEIKTEAMGLNFRDVLVALGQIDSTRHLLDAAGVVTRLGPDTEASGLQVGDRVCGTLNGRFATNPRAPWTNVVKMPDDMSWEEAASLPVTFLTSWICLFDLGRLQRGERVLIHAGAGGVGQSAIMLAKHSGAEVFVTCSSETKRDLLMTTYGLDSEHILSSRDTSFAAAILARTGGAGVDVVLNSLSGPLLKATWECMARFGRFVEIGKVDMEAARRLDLTPLTRAAMICGFDLTQHCAFQGQAVHRAWKAIMQLWNDKAIHAVHPLTTYPIAEMETAMRLMQRGTHKGKIVLLPGPETQVRVLTRTSGLAHLDDANSTYLIAGGLGGIGHALANWMMERGARHILIVSRSAESHPLASPLVTRGRDQGCNVVVRNCDISQEDQLLKLLADCTTTLPPIRGVIQAAMALHDTILERLTFDQWQRSVQPKVAGSLHLHRHLSDLRFFVMLSSIAGVVGHTSQANYAAGNTFQDALARHRTAQGLPAVSIDLGAVGEVGVVAESGDGMRERVERNLGSKVIPIGRVLRLIEAAVCEPLRGSADASQVITGIADYESIPAGTAIKQDRRFATLRLGSAVSATASDTTTARSPDEVLKQSLLASPAASSEALALVLDALTHKLTTLFNLVAAEVDVSASLSALGVDSLVAVELRNWLSSVVQAKVSIFEIVQAATIKEFAGLVVGRSALVA